VILELVGGNYLEKDIACAAHGARIAVVGLSAGAHAQIDLATLMHKRITLFGTVLRARPLEEKIAATMHLRRLVILFEEQKLKPVVGSVRPLDRAGEALDRLARNETFGKVVLEL